MKLPGATATGTPPKPCQPQCWPCSSSQALRKPCCQHLAEAMLTKTLEGEKVKTQRLRKKHKYKTKTQR
jgi:hypothetical protein